MITWDAVDCAHAPPLEPLIQFPAQRKKRVGL